MASPSCSNWAWLGIWVAPSLATLPCNRVLHATCATLQILEADIVLWSAGQAPVTKAAAADAQRQIALPFGTNARGAMQTDATLRVLHHQRVFALGDVAVRWVVCPAARAVLHCVASMLHCSLQSEQPKLRGRLQLLFACC